MNELASATQTNRGKRPARPLAIWAFVILIGSTLVVFLGWVVFQSSYGNRAAAVFKVLHTSIRNGDSMTKVLSTVGPGNIMDDNSLPAKLVLLRPNRYTDGVEDADTFLRYEFDTGRSSLIVFLQFRNGKLINHVPSEYAELPTVTALR